MDSISYFSAFRKPPAPALYDELRSAVTEDVLEIGLITAFTLVFVSILFSAPGLAGDKKVKKIIFNTIIYKHMMVIKSDRED